MECLFKLLHITMIYCVFQNQRNLIKWLKTNYSFLRNKSFTLNKLNSERDVNYIINIQNNKKYVLKISNPSENLNILDEVPYEDIDELIKELMKR